MGRKSSVIHYRGKTLGNMKVFKINHVMCFKFHLHLEKKLKDVYSAKIIQNGGEVICKPADDVFTFTTRKLHDKLSEAFNIKFVDDCIDSGQILDIGKYTLDKRVDRGCSVSLLHFGEKKCPAIELLRKYYLVTDTSRLTRTSPRTSPLTNSPRRIEPVDDYHATSRSALENPSTRKKSQNSIPTTILKILEKGGVSITPLENIKGKKIFKELKRKDEEEKKEQERREESERKEESKRKQERREELKRKEKEREQERREELERREREKTEHQRKKEFKIKEQEKREREKKGENMEKLEREQMEKLDRIEREWMGRLKRNEEENMEKYNRIERKIEREMIEKLERLERESVEKLDRIRRESMDELERIERESKMKTERILQELSERRKKLQERIKQNEAQERKEESIQQKDESAEATEKRAPRITKIARVTLNRIIQFPKSRNSSTKNESQEKSTPRKRALSEENLTECKRSRSEDTAENQIIQQNKICLQLKPQEKEDIQSSEKKSLNLEESSNSAEISSKMRPFTQVASVLTQHSTTDSNEATCGNNEYKYEEEFINEDKFINESQLESAEMDSQNPENSQIHSILIQLPMEDSNVSDKLVVGDTQTILNDLDSTLESIENHLITLSDEKKIQESPDENHQRQNKNKRSENLMTAEEESSPLLDDISKALLEEDSETDFEGAADTPPTRNRIFYPDVTIVKQEIKIEKNTQDIWMEAQENIEIQAMENLNTQMYSSTGERDKTVENNDDDDVSSDAETVIYSNPALRVRSDLIPKSPEKNKQKASVKKKKVSEWRQIFSGDAEETIESFENPRKEVNKEDKNEGKENKYEEKENFQENGHSGKEKRSPWLDVFGPS